MLERPPQFLAPGLLSAIPISWLEHLTQEDVVLHLVNAGEFQKTRSELLGATPGTTDVSMTEPSLS